MFDYSGGWMWLLMDVLLVAALAGALAFGLRSYRRRFRSDRPEERSREFDARRHQELRR